MERIVILVIHCYMCHSLTLTDSYISPVLLSSQLHLTKNSETSFAAIISKNCRNILNIFTAIFLRLIKFVMTYAKIG